MVAGMKREQIAKTIAPAIPTTQSTCASNASAAGSL
jgi:hypothetical protein